MSLNEIAFDPARVAQHEPLAEFPDGLAWVNRHAPLHLADLRGQLVLLVFWNGASVASTSVLSRLRQLERRHAGACVLLAVHTPRYPGQRDAASVLKAAHRMGLRVPVANDGDWAAWQQYGVQAWPTVMLVDRQGRLVARCVGEENLPMLDQALAYLREGGDATPLLEPSGASGGPATTLSFPAHALATDTRLYISDHAHHRVLECSHDGHVLRQFGSGIAGHWDGRPASAGFDLPQGLAFAPAERMLYVADTGNDAIRCIRLDDGVVETVLGAGQPLPAMPDGEVVVRLAAPSALALDGEWLYVAAAGQNQILRVNLRVQRIGVLAGDGRGSVRDGIGAQASLAQPGAVAMLPGQLLVADAGGNAVRRVRLADLSVTTLAGGSAWRPGARDGAGRDARFAYPSGIASDGERVFVADTCNDALRVLDPYTGEVTTLALGLPLHAPQGLSFGAGALWLADRDAHRVLRIDPVSGACAVVPIEEA